LKGARIWATALENGASESGKFSSLRYCPSEHEGSAHVKHCCAGRLWGNIASFWLLEEGVSMLFLYKMDGV
jgi:hypothetical protein